MGNDPLNATDPTGLYGMGSGWDDDSWKKFNRVQQKAAGAMEKRADRLEAKAGKLDAKGKSGGDNLRQAARYLRAGAQDLRSDGSDGKVAHRVDSQEYQALGGSAAGAAFVSDPNTMVVNSGNLDAWASGSKMAQWVVGHESLHSSSRLNDWAFDGFKSYAFGQRIEDRRAFWLLNGTKEGYSKPDNLMYLVFPKLPPPLNE